MPLQIKDVTMIDVKSTNVKSVGYNPKTKKLYVDFFRSGLYEYDDVPENVFKEMLEAKSVGSYFHTHIRWIYTYKKVMRNDKKKNNSTMPIVQTDSMVRKSVDE